MADPKVFLHGWGQGPSIWLSAQLSQHDNDMRLALPGHGGAENLPAEQWSDWLEAQLPAHPVHLVGWSLGAMLALQLAARLPQKVTALTLYAATPCFCCQTDWPHGVTLPQLEAIAKSVQGKKMIQGLTRFTRIMLHGEKLGQAALRQISSQQVTIITPPTAEGLQTGISLLHTLDLRETIQTIHQPVQLIHGQADAVVPIVAAKWLLHHLPNAKSHWLTNYGHMPWKKQPVST